MSFQLSLEDCQGISIPDRGGKIYIYIENIDVNIQHVSDFHWVVWLDIRQQSLKCLIFPNGNTLEYGSFINE